MAFARVAKLLRLTTALWIAAILIADSSDSAWAQANDLGCVSPIANRLYRKLNSRDVSIWLAQQEHTTNVCIAIKRCSWPIMDVQAGDFGHLSPYVAGESCGALPFWQKSGSDSYYRSDCTLTSPTKNQFDNLALLLEQLGAANEICSNPYRATGGYIFSTGPERVILLQLSFGDDCILLFSTSVGLTALVRVGCIATQAEAAELLKSVRKNGLLEAADWLGVEHKGSGFAVELKKANEVALGAKTASWGELDKKYVSEWLTSVIEMARNSSADLPVEADPLPLVSRTAAAGRLARWLLASVHRLADPQGSKILRDWMTQSALLDPKRYYATIFRAEKAKISPVGK